MIHEVDSENSGSDSSDSGSEVDDNNDNLMEIEDPPELIIRERRGKRGVINIVQPENKKDRQAEVDNLDKVLMKTRLVPFLKFPQCSHKE